MCRHPARDRRHRGWNFQSLLRTREKRQIPTSEKAQAVTFWPPSSHYCFSCPPASLNIWQLASLTRSPPAWLQSWVLLYLCAHWPIPMGCSLIACPNQHCLAVDHVPTRRCAHTGSHPQVQPPLTPVHYQCFTRYFCVCTWAQRVLTRKGSKRIVKQTCVCLCSMLCLL